MYNDADTTTCFFTNALVKRFPAVASLLWETGGFNPRKVWEIPGENLWIRDYAPVQVGDKFIQFRYEYGLDNPGFKNLRVDKKAFSFLKNVVKSDIRLDGGNIVYNDGSAIITDTVFRHNPKWKRAALHYKLQGLLDCTITIVPAEPGDDIGHSDGICKFTPTGKLLVHDYRMAGTEAYRRYHNRLMNSLGKFDVVLCPLASAKCPDLTEEQFRSLWPLADTFNPGYGYYLNMLVVGKLVFVPQFNIREDAQVVALVRKHFKGFTIIPVDCALLSMEGGLLNCITAQYKL